jgi:hypothetical protein
MTTMTSCGRDRGKRNAANRNRTPEKDAGEGHLSPCQPHSMAYQPEACWESGFPFRRHSRRGLEQLHSNAPGPLVESMSQHPTWGWKVTGVKLTSSTALLAWARGLGKSGVVLKRCG